MNPPPGLPPNLVLHNLGIGHWISQSLYAVAKLGVADVLASGPMPVEAIASKVEAHADSLYRILRALASVGVFTEPSHRLFALNPLSDLLRSDIPNSMRSLALMTELEWKPWEQIMHCVRTGKTASDHLYGTGFFNHLQQHPDHLMTFNTAMTSFVAQNAQAVCAAYDFSPFKSVIDVGGGLGLLMTSILRSASHTTGVVFDLPPVAENANRHLESAGVADRAKGIGGDFFEQVPAGGNAYVLASVIHDWDDERAGAILRNVRKAIPSDGTLLLVEMVIPPGDVPFFGKFLDLEMLVLFGGRERTGKEYTTLLSDTGFSVKRIIPTPGPASIIEAFPV